MNDGSIRIRLMQADDFDAVVGIDAKVLKASRPEYYTLKFEKLFGSRDYLPTSLVAEQADGTVVGANAVVTRPRFASQVPFDPTS